MARIETWGGARALGAWCAGVLTCGLLAASCTSDRRPLPAPQGPTAAANLSVSLVPGATRVSLTWSDLAPNEQGYRIERRERGGVFAQIGQVSADVTAFVDDAPPRDVAVEYRVVAFAAGGGESASAAVSLFVVWPPTQLAFTASGATVQLTWADSSGAETGFRIERRLVGTTSFVPVAGSPAQVNATSLADGPLTLGASYEYRLITETPAGESQPSALLLVTLAAPPLQIDTSALPAALESWPYSQSVSASGGSGQGKTWSLAGGTLSPLQLVDGTAATLSGTFYPSVPAATPAALGFTLKVSDASLSAAQQSYTLAIDPLRITTLVGNGTATFAGEGALADATGLDANAVAVDAAGNVYASAARRLFRTSINTLQVTTLAGNGSAGDTGDGGFGINATLQTVYDLALDASGNVFLLTATDAAGAGARIRKLDAASGLITLVGGGGPNPATDGAQASTADLRGALRLALAGGSVYFIQGHAVRRIAPTGELSTLAGSVGTSGSSGDGGLATGALFSSPGDLAVDPLSGEVYVADTANHRVRAFALGGNLRTVAGNGSNTPGPAGEGGLATSVPLASPRVVEFDSTGNLFLAQSAGVRRVERASGLLRSFAGSQLTTTTGSGTTGSGTTGSGTTGSGTTGSGTTGSGAPLPAPGEGGPALTAGVLGAVRALAIDAGRQRVYVADPSSLRVRLLGR